MLEASLLLYATLVVSLAILLSSVGVIYMPTVLRPKVRIIATKTMDIKAVLEAMVMVIDETMVMLTFGYP